MSGPFKRYSVLFVGAVPFFVLIIALLLPEQMWGLSWAIDLSIQQILVLVAITGIATILLAFSDQIKQTIGPNAESIVLFLMVGLSVFCQHKFPISNQVYGNSFQYVEYVEVIQIDYPKEAISDVFSLSIAPSSGRKTVLGLYTLVSFFTGSDYGTIFRWAGLLFGFVFSVFWVKILLQLKLSFTSKWVLALFGCFSAPSFVFYNHHEIYAPVFASVMVWLYLFLQNSKEPRAGNLFFLIGLGLINLKLHPLSVFLFIPLILNIAYQHFHSPKQLTWQWTVKTVHIPIWLIGAIVYFIVLKDHVDPRFLTDAHDHERIFLPIFSPEAPLDRYNLLSWNHILDFLNVLLLWGLPGSVMVLAAKFSSDLKASFSTSEVIQLGTGFILLSSFTFMVNPLLSMPMDMDLFMFPGVLFLVMIALLMEHEDRARRLPALAMGLILTIFLSSMFLVNSNKELLSQRLERVGRRIFKTYYLHSSRVLITGIGISEDRSSYIRRKQTLANDLRPLALIGNDPKYANLLYDDAMYYKTVEGDEQLAKARMLEAIKYNSELSAQYEAEFNAVVGIDKGLKLLREEGRIPEAIEMFTRIYRNDSSNLEPQVYLMEAQFISSNFDEAFNTSMKLLDANYPTELVALKRAIHCGLEAEKIEAVSDLAQRYQLIDPLDPTINDLSAGLRSETPVNELKGLFRSPSQR